MVTQWLREGKPQPCASPRAAGTQTLLVPPVCGAASVVGSLSLQQDTGGDPLAMQAADPSRQRTLDCVLPCVCGEQISLLACRQGVSGFGGAARARPEGELAGATPWAGRAWWAHHLDAGGTRSLTWHWPCSWLTWPWCVLGYVIFIGVLQECCCLCVAAATEPLQKGQQGFASGRGISGVGAATRPVTHGGGSQGTRQGLALFACWTLAEVTGLEALKATLWVPSWAGGEQCCCPGADGDAPVRIPQQPPAPLQGSEHFPLPLSLDWCLLGSMGSEKHLRVPQSFLNVSFNYFKAKGIVLTFKKKNREGNTKEWTRSSHLMFLLALLHFISLLLWSGQSFLMLIVQNIKRTVFNIKIIHALRWNHKILWKQEVQCVIKVGYLSINILFFWRVLSMF